MIRSFAGVLVLLCLATYAQARSYVAVVRDKTTKTPLAYVDVGIPGRGIGTVSNAGGLFALDVPDTMSAGAMVIISQAGYEPYRTSLGALAGIKEIRMVRNAERRTVIRNKRLQRRRLLGNTSRVATVKVGFINQEGIPAQHPGYEIGTLIRAERKPLEIDSVFIHFTQCSYDSILLRLNIYEVRQDSFVSVMPQPYYLRCSGADALKGLQIDIRTMKIRLSNDFVIALEQVAPMKPGELLLAAGYLGSKAYVRAASQGSWLKLPMNVGVGISARVRD